MRNRPAAQFRLAFKSTLMAFATSAISTGIVSTVMAAPVEEKRGSDEVSPLTLESIARDWEQWAGMSPKKIRWAPGASVIHFDWNPDRDSFSETYAVAPDGGVPRELDSGELRFAPPAEPTGSHAIDEVDWSRSQSDVVFAKHGDIFLVGTNGKERRQLTRTMAAETRPLIVPGRNAITYQIANNLFLHDLDSGEVVQLTNFLYAPAKAEPNRQQEYLQEQQRELFDFVRESEELAQIRNERRRLERGVSPPAFRLKQGQRITDMSLAPDGDFVVFNLVDDTRLQHIRAVEYPSYVNKDGYVEMKSLGGNAPPVKPIETFRHYRLGRVRLSDGSVAFVDSSAFDKPVSWNAISWSPDGSRAVAWAGSLDHKDLWLCDIDIKSASAKVVFHEHDDAWVRGFRGGRLQRNDRQVTGFLPDSRTVYFMSEQDGWYHLYTVTIDGGPVRQLTKGKFEITNPNLSESGDTWYFLSNENDHLQRHVYKMAVAGGPRTRITPGEGWVEEYALAPGNKYIAYTFGSPLKPMELFSIRNRSNAKPIQLTQSMSDEFRRYPWQQPEYVSFPDKDGWMIHAELHRPERPAPSRPAVIHVHGTGWTQGVAKRFGAYMPDTQLEFQYLAEHGYTVLSIDYKGSRGYGRESRVSVYGQMGVPELESVDAAIEFLVRNENVDPNHIGIFGHSYGGYLTIMALLTRPGVFAAAVAQAPNIDNAHSPAWLFTTRILGIPWQNEEAYRRTSPIHLAEHLQDPLLILHGLEDLNVPAQDTFRLTQRFIELRKTGWDIAIYPIEAHVLRQESGRLDMLRRRFALFESKVKGTGTD